MIAKKHGLLYNYVSMAEVLSDKLFSGVTVIAVSKTVSAERVSLAYQQGFRHFGENRVPEFLEKQSALMELPINWHFIGHLQTNKVARLMGKISLLHSLDSIKLFDKICAEGQKNGYSLPALLQINISEEENKSGFLLSELSAAVQYITSHASRFCPIKGLMCIGSDPQQFGQEKVMQEYTTMREIFQRFKMEVSAQLAVTDTKFFNMEYLSMGMSSDYQTAIDCGSNMVRIGSLIFGERSKIG